MSQTQTPAQTPAQDLAVGSPAPDFTLPAPGRDPMRLADLAGKWVVLYFYPKDSTSGCTTEALEFTGLLPRFTALSAVVLGVSRDSLASHERFAQKNALAVTLLSDPDAGVISACGAWREKTMYGKKGMGIVRSTVLIDPRGRVAALWPKVAKAAGHAAEVLARLEELARG